MLTLLKISCLICLLYISIQDLKERKVYLWLFVVSGFLISYLFYNQVSLHNYVLHIGLNAAIVLIILGLLFAYTKLKLDIPFKDAFGLGDAIFFLIIALGFPVVTFSILFTFSLLFTGVVFVFIRRLKRHKTVPLAGLQALFLFLVLGLNWSTNYTNLYLL